MYDWANSAFMVVIITAIFPIYFSSVAAADLGPEVATFRFTVATTIGLAIIAALSPLLGTIADYAGAKKKLLGGFMLLGVAAVGMMFFIQRGGLAPGGGAFHPGQHRRQWKLRLL